MNEDIERFRGKYRLGWDAVREQRFLKQVKEGIISEKWGLSARPEIYPAWAAQDTARQQEMDYRMAVYAAQVDRTDFR